MMFKKVPMENKPSSILKKFAAFISGLVGVLYLLNPTGGLLELIPDNIPFIGNLDEAGAILLIIGSLRHFGVDLTKSKLKKIMAIVGGILGFIYLLNPTAGVIEIIPDNIPFIGNLDEGVAVILILGCLRHFGLDLTKFFLKKP